MGFFMDKQGSRNDYNLCDFIADTAADVANIPTDAAPGSTLFVIETSTAYMLNTQKQWTEI